MAKRDIYLKIRSEEDLYDPFDPTRRTLSEGLKSYITNKLIELSAFDEAVIHVTSDIDIDHEHIRIMIADIVEKERASLNSDRKKNFFNQIRLLVIGVIFVVISVILEVKAGAVWYTILSTIGAFSIWEASSIWIIENPKLRMKRRVFNRIIERITIVFDGASPDEAPQEAAGDGSL